MNKDLIVRADDIAKTYLAQLGCKYIDDNNHEYYSMLNDDILRNESHIKIYDASNLKEFLLDYQFMDVNWHNMITIICKNVNFNIIQYGSKKYIAYLCKTPCMRYLLLNLNENIKKDKILPSDTCIIEHNNYYYIMLAKHEYMWQILSHVMHNDKITPNMLDIRKILKVIDFMEINDILIDSVLQMHGINFINLNGKYYI